MDKPSIKLRLLKERDDLVALATMSAESAQPVELDQSKVGRLSRMDAMQAQAMSLAVRRRREIQLSRIESALERLAGDEFGNCVRCGEAINSKRLEFDPATLLCIECASAAES